VLRATVRRVRDELGVPRSHEVPGELGGGLLGAPAPVDELAETRTIGMQRREHRHVRGADLRVARGVERPVEVGDEHAVGLTHHVAERLRPPEQRIGQVLDHWLLR